MISINPQLSQFEVLVIIAMSTATQQPPPSDNLILVNSFYGTGATACWYLTCLSCFISWTLHPRKRKSDAITSDFIALVTFPTVASAHLITQIRSWPSESSVDDETLLQMRASLAASLIITETYYSLCIILLLPALFVRTPKRLCLLALTGIFCVLSETYLYFAIPSIHHAPGVFERSFIVDSFPLLVLILVLVSVLVGFLLVYMYLLFRKSLPEPIAEPPPGPDSDTEDDFGLANKHPQVVGLTYWAMPFMFLSLGCSWLLPILDLLVKIYREKKTIWTGRRSFVDEFFPRTEASIMDLDQAVALLAGMSILGFSLHSAADARYKRWWAEEKERREETARQRMQRRETREELRRHLIAIRSGHGPDEENIELQNWRRAASTAQPRSSSAS